MLDTQFAPSKRESVETCVFQQEKLNKRHIFKSVIDNMPYLFMVLNDCRQIIYTNESVLKFLGCKLCEVQGKRPGEALGCANADKYDGGCGTSLFCKNCGAVNAILGALKNTEQIQECRLTTSSGASLDLRVWAYPLPIIDKKYVAFICDDISDEKRRRSLERVFFHDVLNTAGGIQGAVGKLYRAKAERIYHASETAERILDMTSELIGEIKAQKDLAAAEANELHVNQDIVCTRDIVEHAVALYRNHSVCIDREIQILPDFGNYTFYSDTILLSRVVGNMLKNALEASSPGETVKVGCQRRGNRILFEVHNPEYIPEDVQRQIFQRSFSTKGEGRGLGTYSMKMLSSRYLSGDVYFTSTPEQGTVFVASYPFKEISTVVKEEKKDKTPAQVLSEAKKIMIIDDIEINREIIQYILEDEGYCCHGFDSAGEAVDALMHEHYDLVFMDVNMPVMGGIEATKAIRANESTKDIPIIAMSASMSLSDLKAYEAAGMNGHIEKPFDTDQIISIAADWLKKEE